MALNFWKTNWQIKSPFSQVSGPSRLNCNPVVVRSNLIDGFGMASKLIRERAGSRGGRESTYIQTIITFDPLPPGCNRMLCVNPPQPPIKESCFPLFVFLSLHLHIFCIGCELVCSRIWITSIVYILIFNLFVLCAFPNSVSVWNSSKEPFVWKLLLFFWLVGSLGPGTLPN